LKLNKRRWLMNITKKEDNKNIESTRGYLYYVPATDIYENDNEYKMIFDLPGIEKEDINIKIEKDILTLTAENKKEPAEGYEVLREEMEFCGYQRSFNLNGIVDTEKIVADYTNGTLIVTLPKKEEQKTKEIKINIA